jgi:hypothetical protein
MRKTALVFVLLLTAVAAHAATIYDVSGPSPFGFANQTVLVEGWNQNAIYNSVTITAPLEDNSSGGPIGGVEGTVYLTNRIGPGTTAANLVAPPVTVSGLTSTFSVRTLFSGLNLGPGTYYLTFRSTNSNPLSMSMEGSSTPTVTTGPGVSDAGGDGQITPDPFPPATAVTLSAPGNLFVTVTGTLVMNFAIPAISPSTLIVLGIALALIGLKFTVR